MGMYDTVIVPCPECGKKQAFQSKGGNCFLEEYNLENCPDDVLSDVNRHSPYTCECGTLFEVDLRTLKNIKINKDGKM